MAVKLKTPLETARDMLARYLTAEAEILDGKTVSFGGRTLTMVDLSEIQEGRREWERKVSSLEAAAAGRRSPYKLAVFL
ncbi:primosomal replication protein PriB/PriC domain protein [Pseudomonas sp. zfem005]|uniref:primosomal replication protein PriB/PriC domain protein n=1 Tax=Pseudomonas sp. zfem005 TaxID=3078200 RepID=UPI002927A053|nr:primosomal replication protein PriB/PriC domain protein [Pseudomonas sp. zfem005]MDU9415563.1 primosomal replication protein PriB/PriC domain protein [Pseudomonas sp. zfem005]